MDRRKSLLVNLGEAETDAVLTEVAQRLGVRVFPKPRLADALDIDRSGLSSAEYSYALKAHLDFVVADADGRAQFAIEFDGPYHDSDARVGRRDEMKDRICARLGLPLLRIDADYLRTVKGFRLLAWLVEVWFLEQAFEEAQARGEIPFDEPFSPHNVIDHGAGGGLVFTYDLADEARRALWRAHEQGRCPSYTPNDLFRTIDGAGEAYAVLRVGPDRWLISYVRMRGLGFASVTAGELAGDLAVVEVAAKFDEFERGAALAVGREQFDAVMALVRDEEPPRWCFGIAGMNAPPETSD